MTQTVGIIDAVTQVIQVSGIMQVPGITSATDQNAYIGNQNQEKNCELDCTPTGQCLDLEQEVTCQVHEQIINGCTLVQWEEQLAFTIPEYCDISRCISSIAKVNELLGTVYFYLSQAEQESGILASYRERKNNRAVTKRVKSSLVTGKRPIAVNTLERVVADELSDVIHASDRAQAKVLFWKRHLERLERAREALKSISYMLSVEARLSIGEG